MPIHALSDKNLLRYSAACAAAFVFIALALQIWPSSAFDQALLTALREEQNLANPLGPGWVEEMGRDYTALGSIPVLALLTGCTTLFWWVSGQRRAAVTLLLIFLFALLISTGLKWFFDRPRPELVEHATRVYTKSFPSAHAFHSAAVYLSTGLLLSLCNRRRLVQYWVLGLALLVTFIAGASRLYMGVHWPTDILAGWAAGACVSFLGVTLFLRYSNQK